MALQTLWFVLWGLLWAVYFTLDGFDFGAGMLRLFLSRDETDRRVTPRGHRPGVGRQRGVADHGRRSHLRRVPRHLRLHVQLPLPADAAHPVLPDHPRRLHRVPQQGRGPPLARELGLAPRADQLHRAAGARARFREHLPGAALRLHRLPRHVSGSFSTRTAC